MSKLLEELAGEWTPIFDFISDKEYSIKENGEVRKVGGLIVSAVLGRMWRYSQGANKVCQAAMETIAKEIGVSSKTVERAVAVLEYLKLIIDRTPELRHRTHTYLVNEREIIRQLKISQTVGLTEKQVSKTSGTSQSDRRSIQSDRRSVKESIKKESKKESNSSDLNLSAKEQERLVKLQESLKQAQDECNEPKIKFFSDKINTLLTAKPKVTVDIEW